MNFYLILILFFVGESLQVMSEVTCTSLLPQNVQPPIECQDFLHFPVFLQQIHPNVTITINQLSVTPNACRLPSVKLVCVSTFQQCETFRIPPKGKLIEAPRAPCRSLCEEVVDNCAGLGLALPDCQNYPKIFSRITVDDHTYFIPCNNVTKGRVLPPMACVSPF